MTLADVVDAPVSPGSNRKGTPADGAWLHLLPDGASVLVLGRVPGDVVRRLGERVAHLDRAPRPGTMGGYDLVLVGPTSRRAARAVEADQLARHLAPGGRLCLLHGSRRTWDDVDGLLLRFRDGRVVRAAQARDTPGRHRRRTTTGGMLIDPAGTGPRSPAHVVAAAAEVGMDLRGHRFELVDTGRYRTKKIVMRLTGADPGVIVKAVRDPNDNPRIDNERRVLAAVRDVVAWADDVPEPLFWGHHRGRAFLGQRALDGRRLNTVPGRGDLAPFGKALERAVALGIQTHHPVPGDTLPSRLHALHQRFLTLYRPSRDRRRRLAGEVDRLLALLPDIPLVIQHGDLGTWNILLGPDGEVRPLDWESGDLDGLPLWDLFYLARSVAVRTAVDRGRRRNERAYVDEILGAGAVGRRQAELVGRYCRATGTPSAAALPLLITCWMHRAVKEAGRLPPHRLRRGTYVGLLWRTLDSPDAPGLRLLGPGRTT